MLRCHQRQRLLGRTPGRPSALYLPAAPLVERPCTSREIRLPSKDALLHTNACFDRRRTIRLSTRPLKQSLSLAAIRSTQKRDLHTVALRPSERGRGKHVAVKPASGSSR